MSLENFKITIKKVIDRFPVTLIVIFLTSLLLFMIVHWWFTANTENNILRSIFSLIITYFFSIWIYLTSEKLWFLSSKKYLLQLVPILFWISFFIWFDKDLGNFNNIVFFCLSLAWIISYIFIAPYTRELLISLKQVYILFLFLQNKFSIFDVSNILIGIVFTMIYMNNISYNTFWY